MNITATSASLSNINHAKEVYLKTKSEANYYETMTMISYENLIKTVANNVWYPFNIVNSYKNKPTTKEDKEKNAGVLYYMKNITSCKNLKIVKTTLNGWSTDSISIYFKIGKNEYVFEVPDVTKLNTENFSYINDGKLTIYLHRNDVYDQIAASYDINEVMDAFRKYLSEHK